MQTTAFRPPENTARLSEVFLDFGLDEGGCSVQGTLSLTVAVNMGTIQTALTRILGIMGHVCM
jgi:hypothetical protein